MLDRLVMGEVPGKPHTALVSPGGALRYEECLTRAGFEGPYTILYHLHPPQELAQAESSFLAPRREPHSSAGALRRRHVRTSALGALGAGGPQLTARAPLAYNDDVTLSAVRATESCPVPFANGDADELYFVRAGHGVARSPFGDLAFGPGDYLCVPKGVPYQLALAEAPLEAFLVECHGALRVPSHFRNEVGQLRMDAPYSHRDFVRPVFQGPRADAPRSLVVKRRGAYHAFRRRHSPFDVVGFDGAVYPFVFPILAFQPRVGSVHLPPTWHGTFEARGVLVCSFVPRPLDFHPDAVPCPYPHSSVDVDEVIYYVSGAFSSRTGIEPGSVTLHPAGLPHGPQPGRYEASRGKASTDEVAVMLDCHSPLVPAVAFGDAEDPSYDGSFLSPA